MKNRRGWVPSFVPKATQGHHQTLALEKGFNRRGGDPKDEAGHSHDPNNGEVFNRIWTTET